jgi:hypothetical protein
MVLIKLFFYYQIFIIWWVIFMDLFMVRWLFIIRFIKKFVIFIVYFNFVDNLIEVNVKD